MRTSILFQLRIGPAYWCFWRLGFHGFYHSILVRIHKLHTRHLHDQGGIIGAMYFQAGVGKGLRLPQGLTVPGRQDLGLFLYREREDPVDYRHIVTSTQWGVRTIRQRMFFDMPGTAVGRKLLGCAGYGGRKPTQHGFVYCSGVPVARRPFWDLK